MTPSSEAGRAWADGGWHGVGGNVGDGFWREPFWGKFKIGEVLGNNKWGDWGGLFNGKEFKGS